MPCLKPSQVYLNLLRSRHAKRVYALKTIRECVNVPWYHKKFKMFLHQLVKNIFVMLLSCYLSLVFDLYMSYLNLTSGN